MLRYAISLVAYAIALALTGYITYSVAPEGANATTALLITGILALLTMACAVLSMMIKSNRTLGMIGVHVALLIPLIAILGAGMRLTKSLAAAEAGNGAIAALTEQADAAGSGTLHRKPGTDGDEQSEWEIIFPNSDVSIGMNAVLQPKGYQTVGIASTAFLSAFAFISFLLHRPKLPPKPKAKPEG